MKPNHLAIVTRNRDAMRDFLESVIGVTPHKHSGWYSLGDSGFLIHVIPIDEAERPPLSDLHHYYRHLALETSSLRGILASALGAGLEVFQMDMAGDEQKINDLTNSLEFGLRTLFVRDHDGNLWEFLERGHSLPALFE